MHLSLSTTTTKAEASRRVDIKEGSASPSIKYEEGSIQLASLNVLCQIQSYLHEEITGSTPYNITLSSS